MRLSLFAAAAGLLVASAAAYADPVVYTLSGTFTGSIGSTAFTDDAGTITFTGNTSGIKLHSAQGYYTDVDGTATIDLGGIGVATITSSSFGAESDLFTAGFYDTKSGFGIEDFDPAIGDYALTSPFTDSGFLEISYPATFGSTVATSLGALSITGDYNTPATFTAMTPTPEPSSFLLLGTGLIGAAGALRRRFA